MIAAISAIALGLTLASVAGWLLNRRSGVLVQTSPDAVQPTTPDTSDLGLSRTGPTVVHFSASWCGPCAGVRRVVNEVCGSLGDVAHIEIDLAANPVAARKLSVLSLPTTFIFDADGRQRYRSTGVPKVGDLRSALKPLLA